MSEAETILVIGADGMIGRALAAHLAKSGCDILRTTRAKTRGAMELDIARDAASWTPPPAKVAILCAAMTSQEQCREELGESRAVNVVGTLAIAKKLLRQGTRVIFPSTNLVLGGMHARQAADDVYLPRTAYALQKAEVEQRLLKLPRVCVVRFTKVFGRGAPLLRDWCKALQNGEVIRPFSDMPMAPIRLDFAVEALAAMITARPQGIVQVSAKQDITYADAAQFVAERLGRKELVQPVTVARSRIAVEYVPRHTTLDTKRLQKEFRLTPPDPLEAVELGMQA